MRQQRDGQSAGPLPPVRDAGTSVYPAVHERCTTTSSPMTPRIVVEKAVSG